MPDTPTFESRRTPSLTLWVFGIVAWTTLGVLSAAQRVASQMYLGRPADWGTVLPNSLADWWSCGVFTPAFYWLVRRFPIRGTRWWTAASIHLAASLVFVVCKITIYAPILRWLNPGLDRSMAEIFAFGFFGDFLGYWAAVGVLHAVEYYREAREREVQTAALDGALRAGELQMLRAQLQPHFLFNTLQAISTLIHRDASAADRMLTDLGDLLRTSLTSAAAQEVSIADELTFLRRYLDIMCVRFGDRLEVTVDVPDDLLPATVPSLALQPLVENAIRHGMANRVDVGHVLVRARRENGRLILAVNDDGPGLPSAPVPDGVGLANTRERLRRLYGADGSLDVETNRGRGTISDPHHPSPFSKAAMTVRAIVVDDEALARERVATLLGENPGVEVVAQCAGGREAVSVILERKPDLVLLDVQMPDLDGFEVLEAVGADRLPAVVFVTAFDEYALRAFEVHALDYLLKPITPDRFRRALTRALDTIGASRGSVSDPRMVRLLEELAARDRPDRLVIKAGGRIHFLRPAEVDWVEADGKYARLHVGKDVHALRQPLKQVAERLTPHGFVRIHRSAIVNLDRIRELQPWFHGEYVVLLKDGTKLTSSAAYSVELHRLVAGDGRSEPRDG